LDLLFQNLKSAAAAGAVMDANSGQQPEVFSVTFNKLNNSLGLSIVAAKVRFLPSLLILILPFHTGVAC